MRIETVVRSDGVLSPGASIGTLAVEGNLTIEDGVVYDYELDGVEGDRVQVDGTLDFAGELVVRIDWLGGDWPANKPSPGDTFALFTYTGDAPVLPAYSIEWIGMDFGAGVILVDALNNQVVLTQIPEPTTAGLAIFASLWWLTRRSSHRRQRG